jgi:hypothetical protein
VLWRVETHPYSNISTHPLRIDTPKEKNKKKGMTARKRNNNHPLELNIPKSD